MTGVQTCALPILIAQAGTSLPHGMGYALTYFHNIPHGKANGVLLKSYLEFCTNKSKVKRILYLLTLENLDELGYFLNSMLGDITSVSYEDICSYSDKMTLNNDKLKNHPSPVGRKDILNIYKNSLKL